MSTSALFDVLSQKLEQKRKEHPSFRLMEIDDRLFPNAQTKHSTLVLEARNSNDESKTVAEIVAESWKKGDKNHLMIEGEGGIGKTVTLLSIPDKFTPFPVPAIYIPLHELPQGDDPIERYIKKKVLNNKEDLYGQLLDLLDNPWDKGPQLLLLLDGFNEIAAENRQTISEDIKYWSEFQGIQIVTSSRYDIHTYVALSYDYSAIKLQPLSNTTAEAYLNSMGARIPTDSAVKELITIPLLLTLYVKTELILEQRETDSAEFKEVKNAGTIVWNYLQCELWRFGREAENAKTAIIAMEFIAPYLAWQMQKNSLFVLSKKEFHDFIDDAYRLLESHFNEPTDFSFHIQDALQIANGIPSLELIRNLLENHLCLFVKNGNSYKLMHQQFHDALAAIHLINSIYLNGNSRPKEWNSTVDHYVMQFVADLISEKEAIRMWEQNRNTKPAIDNATRNQLQLQGLLHDNDFSHLDFSGIDLSNISMYLYRANNTQLRLPTDSNKLKKTILAERTFKSLGNLLSAIVETPDSKRIISSGSNDHTIRVWDTESGVCLRMLEGHEAPVLDIDVTPNGRCIVSGSEDGTVKVWDLENGACLKTLESDEDLVLAVTVTSDSSRIISISSVIYSQNFVFDKWHNQLEAYEFGIDEDKILCNSRIIDNIDAVIIRIWDIESGVCLMKLEEFDNLMDAIAKVPNSNGISTWELEREIRKCEHKFEYNSRMDNIIIKGRKNIVGDPYNNTIRIWDFGTISNDLLFKGGPDDIIIRIWDLDSGECIKTLTGLGMHAVTMTPNGRHIIGGYSDTIQVWDVESEKYIKTLEGHESWVDSVVVTSDGKRVVSDSIDGTTRIWDLENRVCLKTIKTHDCWDKTIAIAVTPDCRFIIKVSYDGTMRIWNLERGECVSDIKGECIRDVAMTPDGKHIVSGSIDGAIQVWDVESGECLNTFWGHEDSVLTIAMTQNGKRIISGYEDGAIQVWDVESGECLKTLMEDENTKHRIAVTHDSRHIVSISSDSTIRVWDLEKVELIRKMDVYGEYIDTVFITSDCSRIMTSSWYINREVLDLNSFDFDDWEPLTIHILPLSLAGLDFSKAIFSTLELKETLRQNGAKVDPD